MAAVASPPKRTSSVMRLLGRMNPLVCLGASSADLVLDDVVDDPCSGGRNASSENESEVKKSDETYNTRNGCMTPLRARYQPNDKSEEVLTSDYLVDGLEQVVPQLLKCISSSPPPDRGTPGTEAKKTARDFNTKRSCSLRELYELTKKGKEHNRVPLVCTAKWDVVGILSTALMNIGNSPEPASDDGRGSLTSRPAKDKPSLDEDRRLICWTLNNLSIPYENKATMALGENSSKLLQALTFVIQSNLPESYLCCICFMNLTFLADAIRPVTLFVPAQFRRGQSSITSSRSLKRNSSLWKRSRSANGVTLCSENSGSLSEDCGPVLDNPTSLLRTVEWMMVTNAPFLLSTVLSVQGEAIRWACGFIRNVTFAGEAADGNKQGNELNESTGRQGIISNSDVEELCTLIARTEIPRLVVLFVKDSPHATVKWTKDSLEDIALGVMCNLAQWPSSQEALKRAGAVNCLEKIERLPGIHGYRARAIRCSLGTLPMQFG